MKLSCKEGYALLKVQPELVADVYKTFEDEYPWAGFLGKVENGLVHLWRNRGAVVCADITGYPTELLVLHIIAAQGDMDSVLDLVDEIEEWCREVGVDRITLQGRRGWERIGEPRGYELQHVVLKKDLEPTTTGAGHAAG